MPTPAALIPQTDQDLDRIFVRCKILFENEQMRRVVKSFARHYLSRAETTVLEHCEGMENPYKAALCMLEAHLRQRGAANVESNEQLIHFLTQDTLQHLRFARAASGSAVAMDSMEALSAHRPGHA